MKPAIQYAMIAALVLTAALSSGAVTLPPGGSHYTAAQIKQLIRKAHTPDQYRVIVQYYEERQSEYSQKAADEMAEWARRSQDTTGPAAKYPRPVDAARNLYEYYAHESDDAAFQAEKFRRFAAGADAASK
ncbi:MAG TPA: hypothetical protein VGG85_04100 [Terracidiphilus sp.]|jgi:hypothetical protein